MAPDASPLSDDKGRPAGPPAPLCALHEVSVRYGARLANDRVSLTVRPGEVVALLGENGAGKSTLLHALYGFVGVSAGQVRYRGEVVTPSPERAIAAGIGLVHQHFLLVPRLTVAENVVLGSEPRRLGVLLDRRRAVAQTAALARKYGLDVDPERPVAELSVGEAQRVEILKALYRGARCLLLDEPTAVLTPGEAARLLSVLREMLVEEAAGDNALVIVTHKLDEVLQVADRAVVMRGGRLVAELHRSEFSAGELARAMVGRELQPIRRRAAVHVTESVGATAESPLVVRDLRVVAEGVERVRGVSLHVPAGTIVGLAGVEGNGQRELCAAIAGLLPAAAGQVFLAGHEVSAASVRARKRRGLGFVPEDRQRHGLVLDFSLAENLMLGDEDHYVQAGGLGRGLGILAKTRLHATAQRLLAEHDVRPADPTLPARALSGGNQQKLLLLRALYGGGTPPAVLLAAQPTRGVDIGAIESIHRALLQARDRGCAILLASAELDELRTLCDRIAVMYRGQILAELPNHPGAPASRERLGELLAGVM
jgi:simple sugar transport system ATP-binding protein